MKYFASLVLAASTLAAAAPTTPPAKAAIRGLTAMNNIKISNAKTPDNSMREINVHPGIYRATVINVLWKTIEPARGKFDFSSIDEGLRAVAKYNAKYPATPVVAKLRVFVGSNVPEWLMPLTGGPLKFEHKGEEIALAGWWTDSYRTEWKALQTALATKYDADPLMGEVAAASCATVTDESFLYPHDPKVLTPAGFTDDKERACLFHATDDYSPWKLTPVDLTFSDLVLLSPKGEKDYATDIAVMKAWRAAFGERGVISNHSAQDPITDHLKPIFEELKQVGPPIEIQTASQGVIEHGKETNGQEGASRSKSLPPLMDWNNVIQHALDIHAQELEIWTTVDAGGSAKITVPMLQAWAAKLK